MNRTGIEWATHTWNPVTGCWGPEGTVENPNRCPGCYAERFARRLQGRSGYPAEGDPFRPIFHNAQFDRKHSPLYRKKPARIFVSSMGDLWGDWVPEPWQEDVLAVCEQTPQHTYLFLTKNPFGYGHSTALFFPDNAWLGVSGPSLSEVLSREMEITAYTKNDETVTNIYGSLEPRYHWPTGAALDSIARSHSRLAWLIVGAMTGPKAKQYPVERVWLRHLVAAARQAGIPVFLKNNLAEVWGEPLIQEFPEGIVT